MSLIEHTVADTADPITGVNLRDPSRSDSRRNETQLAAEKTLATLSSHAPLALASGTTSDGRSIHANRSYAAAGLAAALAGSADVVNVDVAQRLVSFSDPVRAILNTSVHTTQKVIVKRKYVAGGGASVVPERAPARTVAVQEEAKECVLTRYGSDIEWNLNLMLKPDEFQREFNMKLTAQKEALQNAAIASAYDMLMTEGTSLVSALVASNSSLHQSAADAATHAERIRVSSVFGAMQRFNYPVHNLLSAVKQCSAYCVSASDSLTMIVPHGTPELHTYTKAENMVSYIHGVKHGDPLTAKVTGGQKDVGNGVTVFCHVPPAMNTYGAARPNASASLLENEVTVAMFCRNGRRYIDHKSRKLVTASADCVRVYKLSMLSGIVAATEGANSIGEIMLGYPSTSLGSDISTETGRMRLRVYIGAALFRPENVVVLEDISFNGIIDSTVITKNLPAVGDKLGNASPWPEGNDCIVYQGTEYDDKQLVATEMNTGHLGCVDTIECQDRIFGTHVYSSTPSAVSTHTRQ